MRVLVVIPYCIENEFSECIASLRRQTFRRWEHLVLRDLLRETADDTVYKTFMRHADEFDLCIKLDADMVIEEESFLTKVVDAFSQHPWIDMLSLPVCDYFTDRLIPAINIYRSTVRFPLRHDGLFTDLDPVADNKALFGLQELNGVVSHCKNPSPFQAFHFGLHRGVKIVEGNLAELWERVALHAVNQERVWRNFLKRGDQRLGLAVLGAELALAGILKREHVDYSNPHASEVCRRYENWTSDQLRREIRRLRWRNWGWLPWPLRLAILNRSGAGKWRAVGGRVLRKLRMTHGRRSSSLSVSSSAASTNSE